MRLAFFGSTGFGLRCLEAAAAIPEVEVVGILTTPKKFAISYRPEGVTNVLHAEFGDVARTQNVPVLLLPQKMTDPVVVETVSDWKPDLILVAGWYHMVPKSIRDLALTIGLHASLLPDYSGGAPLVWAMIQGETRTGISLFKLGAGVDAGPLLGQAEEPIYFEDTIATLYARIEDAGVRLLAENLPKIVRGEATWVTQDESRRRIMPQRGPEDGRVDWSWSARRVYDFIRAQTRPYPGAFTFWQGKKLILWAASLPPAAVAGLLVGGEQPGVAPHAATVGLPVVCGDGSVVMIHEVEYEGRPLAADEFCRAVGLAWRSAGIRPGVDDLAADVIAGDGAR